MCTMSCILYVPVIYMSLNMYTITEIIHDVLIEGDVLILGVSFQWVSPRVITLYCVCKCLEWILRLSYACINGAIIFCVNFF